MYILIVPGVGEQREETAELRPHIFRKTVGVCVWRNVPDTSNCPEGCLSRLSLFDTEHKEVAANTRGNRLFQTYFYFLRIQQGCGRDA